jgi:hypothetical protein
MAKGNLFQGMGRGKVGDVVFSRLNGEQISRVRNRHPKNPRSNSQLYQRAIMATVMQAYSAGKAIFDHSFEGYAVGAQNQRRFLSMNAKMLRQLVATDINTPIATNSQKARVVAPGVSVPVANPFIISRGSYQQTFFAYDAEATEYTYPEATGNETVAAYVTRNGLIAGDIYTFVMLAEKKDIAYESNVHDDVLASQNYCSFGFVRLIVKDSLSNDTTPIRNLAQIFSVQNSGGDFAVTEATLQNWAMGGSISLQSFIKVNTEDYTKTGAIGVIRSRLDQDLRSDSVMNVLYGSTAEDMFGIASDYILDEWKNATTSVGDSDLILEGGDI